MVKFYKIIRFCRLCKTKFFVENQRDNKYYCDECKKKILRDNAIEVFNLNLES